MGLHCWGNYEVPLKEIMEKYFTKEEGLFCECIVDPNRGWAEFTVCHKDMKRRDAFAVKWELSELPGCCGVIVSHDMATHPDYQGRGFAQKALKCKIEMAQFMYYTQMVATTIKQNDTEQHILKKFGFKKSWWMDFKNFRTGNTVLWFHKELDTSDY